MSETIEVTIRQERGTRAMRRLRATGHVPAILYGHGQESVSLTVNADDVYSAIRHGAKLFELKGGVQESAFLRDLQWDGLGSELLHVDFTRVDAAEMVTTVVAIELRGDAPGTHEGGVVEQPLHEIEIDCPAAAIPEKFVVTINSLQLEQSITAGDIPLPEKAKLLTDPHQIVVHCVTPTVVEEEEEAAGEGAEPEVIGKKEESEEEEG